MATTPRNLNYRKLLDAITFAVSTATSFNEGDLMVYDTGTHLARPIAAAAEAAYLLGNVEGTSPVTYHSALKSVAINCGFHTVKLIARESATFYKFTPVYFSTDAQSFCITDPVGVGSGTTPIGYMLVDPKENGGADSGTAVVGNEYEVALRESYRPTGTHLG